jgi:hypothetical protein
MNPKLYETALPGIEVTEIVTEQDRRSYALGVRLARRLRAHRSNVDIALLLCGMKDAVNGCPLVE